jgi:hypothetical protein
VLNERVEKADMKPILADIERGFDRLKGTRGVNEKSKQFVERLTALLNELKKILDEFASAKKKDWEKTAADFKQFRQHYDAFRNDYDIWIRELTGGRDGN